MLFNLADWNEVKASPNVGAACGTACGASKPSSACGAGGDEPKKKPAACGSACGAGK